MDSDEVANMDSDEVDPCALRIHVRNLPEWVLQSQIRDAFSRNWLVPPFLMKTVRRLGLAEASAFNDISGQCDLSSSP